MTQLESYHCNKLKKLSLSKMCPSVALGFYISNSKDFNDFTEKIKELGKGENSIFTVYDRKPEQIK